jgi:hypothetical protein
MMLIKTLPTAFRGAVLALALALAAVASSASAAPAPDGPRAFAGGASGSLDELAKHLLALDPAAHLGGESIVGTKPGQALHGVHGKPNFIIALGDGETIHGASSDDELGAGPHAKNVEIIAPAGGHALLVGGPESKIVASGNGHNLIYSHAAGATIVLESPGDEVIANGPHDKIVCAAHASHELIEVADGDKVSKSCKGHHNTTEHLTSSALSARFSAATAHAANWFYGSGSNTDPFVAACDEQSFTFVNCTVTFGPRQLNGLWSYESVPAYKCPPERPYLVNRSYAPFGTLLPDGVEVSGLGPIGVSIEGTSPRTPDRDLATGTFTGKDYGTATNWVTGSASYRVILHCTSDTSLAYYV